MIKNFIQDLFIPEKINNYYIFPQRIIGFDIGKRFIVATQLYINGSSAVIEKIIMRQLPSGSADHTKYTVAIIKDIIAQCDRYDAVYSVLPSLYVVLKNLTVPFTGKEKINLIINYEVEPPLHQSIQGKEIDKNFL